MFLQLWHWLSAVQKLEKIKLCRAQNFDPLAVRNSRHVCPQRFISKVQSRLTSPQILIPRCNCNKDSFPAYKAYVSDFNKYSGPAVVQIKKNKNFPRPTSQRRGHRLHSIPLPPTFQTWLSPAPNMGVSKGWPGVPMSLPKISWP